MTENKIIIANWSGGITSAVATKLAIDKYKNITILYTETGSHHPDSIRFKNDCEKWYGQKIEILQSKYKNHFEVIEKHRYVNGPYGARCTRDLKINVRKNWEKTNTVDLYIWGFEYSEKEKERAGKIASNNPGIRHEFPLIDAKLTKQNCIDIMQNCNIKIPEMYQLGFHNNNCVGCVKGGAAYWNMIRKEFPEVFSKMAVIERNIGRSCLKKYFLDELPIEAGRNKPPLVLDCGATGEGCEIQLSKAYWAFDND